MAHLLNNVLFILNRQKIYVAMHCKYYVTIYSTLGTNSKS